MKLINGRPYVTAGLVAALGLGAGIAAVPTLALADEQVVIAQEVDQTVIDDASGAQDVQDDEEEAPSASGASLMGVLEVEPQAVVEGQSEGGDSVVELPSSDTSQNNGASDEGEKGNGSSDQSSEAVDPDGSGSTESDPTSGSGQSGTVAQDVSEGGADIEGTASNEEAVAEDSAESTDGAQTEAESETTEEVAGQNMYRLYNPNTGEHFYTSSLAEAVSVVEAGWRYEGVGWVAPTTSSKPVYRLYNPNAGDHHYTTSAEERDTLVSLGWKYEGVGWYSDTDETVAVYRQYNPNAVSGGHNFTTSSAENSNLVESGWKAEGTAWYATSTKALELEKGVWLTTSAWGTTGTYWLGTDTKIAKDRVITADEAGSNYYATSTGAIATGKYSDGKGHVYLADKNGKLTSATGMLVTGDYDNGSMHRYYLEEVADGVSAAKTGVFVATDENGASNTYYGRPDEGYVLTSKYDSGKGYVYLADSSGRLATGTGWLVTDVYDGALQRYWLITVDGGISAAKSSLFTVSGDATLNGQFYGVGDQGYVLRGKMLYTSGSNQYMLLADYTSGLLETSSGWLTTSKYDGSSQIYYLVDVSSGYKGAKIGEFKVGGNLYYGREDTGYIVRGVYNSPNGVYYGDATTGVIDQNYKWLTAVGRSLWSKINGLSSSTQYLIAVDCDNFRTVVFRGSKNNWVPIFDWACGTGSLAYNDGKGTIRGIYTIGGNGSDPYWTHRKTDGYSGPYSDRTAYQEYFQVQYMTCFYLSLGFHSTTPYDGPAASQLGKYSSHGCIRLLTENAKWIYDNCKAGTTVRTF